MYRAQLLTRDSPQAHIADPNERRRLALAEIDKAPFGWYHVRAIIVAGIGFFTDAYDLFAIGLVTNMLGVVYWQTAKKKKGTIPTNADTAIKVSTSAGKLHVTTLVLGVFAHVICRYRYRTGRFRCPRRYRRPQEDVRS